MADKFTLEYDAITGLYMVEALRAKAEAETAEAEELETLAFGGGPETDFNDVKALQARNRARLLQKAADKIHKAVHAELVSNFDEAFKRQGL
jgi:hypothetical protein